MKDDSKIRIKEPTTIRVAIDGFGEFTFTESRFTKFDITKTLSYNSLYEIDNVVNEGGSVLLSFDFNQMTGIVYGEEKANDDA